MRQRSVLDSPCGLEGGPPLSVGWPNSQVVGAAAAAAADGTVILRD